MPMKPPSWRVAFRARGPSGWSCWRSGFHLQRPRRPRCDKAHGCRFRLKPDEAPAIELESDHALKLIGQFATLLDVRITAAFQLAEAQNDVTENLTTVATAILLPLLLNFSLAPPGASGVYPTPLVLLGGLLAVPLAPAAKTLSSTARRLLAGVGSARTESKADKS
jgi:hypothetical protein